MNPAAFLFDQWAVSGKGETMAQGHWPMTRQILERMQLTAGLHCVDVGCGNGYAVREMALRVQPEGQAYGIDIAPMMIALARSYPDNPANVDFQVGSAECLPFEAEKMDRLLSVETLYYMADPLQVLQGWRRVLRPSGSIWLMVDFYQENPYCYCWADLLNLPMHLYSEGEYVQLLQNAGFREVQVARLYNTEPLSDTYRQHFKPGWGYDSLDDVLDFRTRIGSLLITGVK